METSFPETSKPYRWGTEEQWLSNYFEVDGVTHGIRQRSPLPKKIVRLSWKCAYRIEENILNKLTCFSLVKSVSKYGGYVN